MSVTLGLAPDGSPADAQVCRAWSTGEKTLTRSPELSLSYGEWVSPGKPDLLGDTRTDFSGAATLLSLPRLSITGVELSRG